MRGSHFPPGYWGGELRISHMGNSETPSRPRDWTTWLIVAIVVLLTVIAFVLLASTYFPLT